MKLTIKSPKYIAVLMKLTTLLAFAADNSSDKGAAVAIQITQSGTVAVCGREVSSATSREVMTKLFGEPVIRRGRNEDMLVFPKGGISLLISRDASANGASLACLLQAGSHRDKEMAVFHGLVSIDGRELPIGDDPLTSLEVQRAFKDLVVRSDSFGPTLLVTTRTAVVSFALDADDKVSAIVLSFK